MPEEKYIVSITTRWGVAQGGINSFNTDFCKALGKLVRKPYKVVCAVEDFDTANMLRIKITGST